MLSTHSIMQMLASILVAFIINSTRQQTTNAFHLYNKGATFSPLTIVTHLCDFNINSSIYGQSKLLQNSILLLFFHSGHCMNNGVWFTHIPHETSCDEINTDSNGFNDISGPCTFEGICSASLLISKSFIGFLYFQFEIAVSTFL